jgi:hypothetical protein
MTLKQWKKKYGIKLIPITSKQKRAIAKMNGVAKNKIKSQAGRIGGSATTKRKRLAAIRNGAKGGRPRKMQVTIGKIPTVNP